MTVEQIELRKILTQMLADNGINRETILDFVREVISEKIDKAVKTVVNDTNLDEKVRYMINNEIKNSVREEVRDNVRRAFSNIHVTVNCSSEVETK